jgi:DNA polymerase-3 subunit alpha
LNGGQSVRVEADLPNALRALPGVRTVKLAMSRPWS